MSNDLFKIGGFGRYVIFSGVFMACMCVGVYFGQNLAHLVGERALPYVILVIILATLLAVGGYLFSTLPRKACPAGWNCRMDNHFFISPCNSKAASKSG